jgi:hypothetical protein
MFQFLSFLKLAIIIELLTPNLADYVKMGLSFAVGFIQRLLNRERELDFSPEYKTARFKSSSLCHHKIRPINGTAKDKKTLFTQYVNPQCKLSHHAEFISKSYQIKIQ